MVFKRNKLFVSQNIILYIYSYYIFYILNNLIYLKLEISRMCLCPHILTWDLAKHKSFFFFFKLSAYLDATAQTYNYSIWQVESGGFSKPT